jgi:hypothetical protein
MIDTILAYLTKVMALPRPFWAVSAGLLISFGITYRLKNLVPANWSAHARDVAIQTMAFAIGFCATYLVWGPPPSDALVAAFTVGLLSPALWNVLLLVIGWWKPELRDVLKGKAP